MSNKVKGVFIPEEDQAGEGRSEEAMKINPGSTIQTINMTGPSPATNPYGYPMPNPAAPPVAGPDDWARWSNYILLEMKRLNDCNNALTGEIQKMQIEIAKLAVKASVWGLLGGILASLAAVLLKVLN